MEAAIEIDAGHKDIRRHAALKSPATPLVSRVLNPVIFVSLLTTIVLTAIPYGTVQPWWIAIFECAVFALGILAIIDGLISKRWSGKLNLSLLTPLVVFILFVFFQSLSLFSGAISADPYNTRLIAIRLIALAVAGGLLYIYTSSEKRLTALVSVVIGVAVASALFGLLRKQFQSGPGFWLPALPNDTRSFAQFINRNHFGFLIEMAWGLTLGLLFTKATNRRRIFFLLPIALFLWVMLVISNSRGAIVASLGQVLFLGLLLDPLRRLNQQTAVTKVDRLRNFAGGLALRAVLVVGMVAVFAYGVVWVGGESISTSFQMVEYSFAEQSNYARANVSRNEIWLSSWKLIKAHPLAGVGLGGYWIGITRYHDATGRLTPQEAHNDYLELLASGGLIGVALVVWFVVAFANRARHVLRSQDSYFRAAALGALVGIFGVLIHSFVDFGLHVTANALILSALIAIAVRPATKARIGS